MQLHRLSAVALLTGLACATAALGADRSPEWVGQRVQQWQPTARERAWEGIGWARDLRDAQRLARAHGRPVFLFTLDGRMNVGRC
jgi:hypothetical protein